MGGKKRYPTLQGVLILGVTGLCLAGILLLVSRACAPNAAHLVFNDRIGVVPVEGTILDSNVITSQLVSFRKDPKISVIVLRINSPGGSIGPVQEIHREVTRTREMKKVVASMGGIAASGGYYVAAAADKIVANEGTITGSIGVLMEFLWYENLLEKIGVKFEVLKSGEYKDMGSPYREMTESERRLIGDVVDDLNHQFVQAVSQGRNLSYEAVDQIADGRIFSGAQAKELGLVDALGNFYDAVALAKELGGLRGEVSLIYPKEDRLSILNLLFESAARSFLTLVQRSESRFQYRWNCF
jgi:protease-4